MRKRGLKFLRWGIGFFIVVLLLVVGSYQYIEWHTQGTTYDHISEVPHNKVGVVLGTSPYLKSGATNPYFQYRIDAAVALFNAQKIDFILVSGDNATVQYNEPKAFKKALINKGIPKEKIFLDYAGFRTLDSMIRAYEVFGQEKFTVISQKFHNQRAVFIARQKNIQAVGFNATDLPSHLGIKTQIREYLARTKVFFDLIFSVQPKFLGEKIEIK